MRSRKEIRIDRKIDIEIILLLVLAYLPLIILVDVTNYSYHFVIIYMFFPLSLEVVIFLSCSSNVKLLFNPFLLQLRFITTVSVFPIYLST